jgi:hypothetical protein
MMTLKRSRRKSIRKQRSKKSRKKSSIKSRGKSSIKSRGKSRKKSRKKSRRKSRKKSRRKSRGKSKRRLLRGGFFGLFKKKSSPVYYYDAGTGKMTRTRPLDRAEVIRQADARYAASQSRERSSSMYRAQQARYREENLMKMKELVARQRAILGSMETHKETIRKLGGQLARLNQEMKVFQKPQKGGVIDRHVYDPNLEYM